MKPRVITLKLNKEFKRAYYQGKFKAHPFLVTYMIKNRAGKPRLGITTSKKVGGAVLRNRARRVIRQAYRELLAQGDINPNMSFDIVFVARGETALQKTQDIKKIMRKQLLNLLSQPNAQKKNK